MVPLITLVTPNHKVAIIRLTTQIPQLLFPTRKCPRRSVLGVLFCQDHIRALQRVTITEFQKECPVLSLKITGIQDRMGQGKRNATEEI